MIRVVLRKEKRICILVIRCKILDAITEFLSFISGGLKKPTQTLYRWNMETIISERAIYHKINNQGQVC